MTTYSVTTTDKKKNTFTVVNLSDHSNVTILQRFSWTIHEVFGIVQFIVWCPTALFKNIDDESKMLVAFNRLNHKT